MVGQTSILKSSKSEITDCLDLSEILRSANLNYSQNEDGYVIGDIPRTQGWVLFIYVVLSQVEPVLKMIAPILADRDIPFRVPKDLGVAHGILDGVLGVEKLSISKMFVCVRLEQNGLSVGTAEKYSKKFLYH